MDDILALMEEASQSSSSASINLQRIQEKISGAIEELGRAEDCVRVVQGQAARSQTLIEATVLLRSLEQELGTALTIVAECSRNAELVFGKIEQYAGGLQG
jgi:hypothetical protein